MPALLLSTVNYGKNESLQSKLSFLVRLKGLEPPVSRFVAAPSIQMSYRRKYCRSQRAL